MPTSAAMNTAASSTSPKESCRTFKKSACRNAYQQLQNSSKLRMRLSRIQLGTKKAEFETFTTTYVTFFVPLPVQSTGGS
eukprot:NODE_3509_length_358_cov_61.152104_g3427_i0.p1 GENE.NODE_3509_length_358_cov_61.152104_g3427_i0~~NODE_3509_length_358_cov_61.152104_g3427_i0.p1  ORF type:complete len:80 (+),score=2.82 NODE_3509_length_358_cov_61.152104_g3427_i0:64-303(+)